MKSSDLRDIFSLPKSHGHGKLGVAILPLQMLASLPINSLGVGLGLGFKYSRVNRPIVPGRTRPLNLSIGRMSHIGVAPRACHLLVHL